MARMTASRPTIKQGARQMPIGQLVNNVIKPKSAYPSSLPFTPGLHVMSDPDGKLTLTGSDVDAMLDQSGNGFNVSHAAGFKATRNMTHQLDGKNSIDSTTGNFYDYTTAAGVTQEDVFPSRNGTIMGVIEVESYRNFFGEEDWIFCVAVPASGPGAGAFSVSVITGPKIRFRVTVGSGGQVVDIAISLNTKYVITMHWDGTIKLKAQVDDGVEQQNAAGGTHDALAQNRLQMLGNSAVSGGRFDGWLWELFGKDGDVGATNIEAAKQYFKGKYASLNV